jgi:tRNA (guanine37-N1)-methyltransferase
MRVPEVLLSGHHAEIERWRRARAAEKTIQIRSGPVGAARSVPKER